MSIAQAKCTLPGALGTKVTSTGLANGRGTERPNSLSTISVAQVASTLRVTTRVTGVPAFRTGIFPTRNPSPVTATSMRTAAGAENFTRAAMGLFVPAFK